jgi:GT2 family glycosyltransferase
MLPASDFSISIINFNGMATLPDTLAGLQWAYDAGVAVYLIDDGSTDGSPQWAAEHFPAVRVTSMGRNTKHVNRVRNKGLSEPTTPHVMLLDNDILLTRETVETLAAVMRSRPGGKPVLCCTPRLVCHDDREKIYFDGAAVSYLMISTALVRGVRVGDRPDLTPRASLGCGIMWIDRAAALEVGGFNQDLLFGWGDDGEFQMRGRVLGYDVLHVPAATAVHVEKSHGRDRIYAQFRNRYRIMLTLLEGRTLLLATPMLVLFELMMTGAALVGGFWGERMAAIRDTWKLRGGIREARRQLQRRRRVGDRGVFTGGRISGVSSPGKSKLIRAAAAASDLLFDGYWRLIRGCLSRDDAAAEAPGPAPAEVGHHAR